MLENDGMALRTEKFRLTETTIVDFHPQWGSIRVTDVFPAILGSYWGI